MRKSKSIKPNPQKGSRFKKLMIWLLILLSTGSLIFGSITTAQNLKLEKQIVALTEERDSISKEYDVYKETITTEMDELRNENTELGKQLEEKEAKIKSLNNQITELKKK